MSAAVHQEKQGTCFVFETGTQMQVAGLRFFPAPKNPFKVQICQASQCIRRLPGKDATVLHVELAT
jgi:hypothetical protein